MNKKQLSEQEIRTRYITPAIQAAGWKPQQIREEVTFTAGRIIVRGTLSMRSQERKRLDYLLHYKPNIPLALVEAKDNNHALSAGMDQALEYAEALDVPFVYTSNGDGFMEHDRTASAGPVERELTLAEFPSPAALWQRLVNSKQMAPDVAEVVEQDYYLDRSGREPRYYQLVAINRTVEAIARGQRRILLVMATGTGKTYTAFHIIWRLWKARTVKRVLFLADRNILIDQTMTNDFKHFGEAMTKITGRQVDKSYEIYLALYQGISGTEDWQNAYRQFSPEFFDLIIVDECHRGSAADDSAWREVLEYFSSAVQIGLTATPKETADVSNIDYFGEPIYTYSLSQGIEDGFLAPYKVIRIDLDRDVDGWRPRAGELDRYGTPIPDELFTSRDFDRTLVLDERTKVVAWRVSEYLRQIGPLPEDHRLLRGHRARRADAPRHRQPERRPGAREPALRDAHHRRQPGGQGRAGQLHQPGRALPGDRDHLQAAQHRRRYPDLPPDRPGPHHQLDDRVQADHRPRHAYPRGLRQDLLHHHGLPQRHPAVCRSGLRRRSGADLRAGPARSDRSAGG